MSVYQSLGEAVVCGKVEDIQALIKDGADVNKRDYSGRIALDYCVFSVFFGPHPKDRLEKAQFLLENGTQPNNEDKFGWTVVHQCAWNGDLALLRLCVRKGAKIRLRTKDHRLPVQLAATRGHMDVVRYLDSQSCDLKSLCRVSIIEAMGKRHHNQINELPLPPTVKLFVNFGIPYTGFEATLIPPQPWTLEEIHSRNVSTEHIHQFICENASQEFLEENKGIVGEAHSGGASAATCKADLSELVEVFQSMYLWEAFKSVKFEEPLARKPRYSMEKLEKKEDDATSWKLLTPIAAYVKTRGCLST